MLDLIHKSDHLDNISECINEPLNPEDDKQPEQMEPPENAMVKDSMKMILGKRSKPEQKIQEKTLEASEQKRLRLAEQS